MTSKRFISSFIPLEKTVFNPAQPQVVKRIMGCSYCGDFSAGYFELLFTKEEGLQSTHAHAQTIPKEPLWRVSRKAISAKGKKVIYKGNVDNYAGSVPLLKKRITPT